MAQLAMRGALALLPLLPRLALAAPSLEDLAPADLLGVLPQVLQGAPQHALRLTVRAGLCATE